MIIHVFLILSAATLLTGCATDKNVKITVVANHYPVDTLRLVWRLGELFQEEKIPLTDGCGKIEIALPEYSLISIINDDPGQKIVHDNGTIPTNPINFFAENGETVRIEFDNDNWPVAHITGGKVNTDYMRLWSKTGPLRHEERILQGKKYSPEETDREKLQQALVANSTARRELENEFIRSNPDSYVSLHLLTSLKTSMPLEEYEQLFLKLDEKVRNTDLGNITFEQISTAKKSSPGHPAPDFSKKDKDGNTIRLSDLKGKYVLIDFWGTWCMPCRKSHPHLVKLHKTYAPRGVQFINVAHEFDTRNRHYWLKAIEEDKLTWTQILNDEGLKECDLVNLYAVTAFPTKILIDPEGKIVARYSGDSKALDEKLEAIFKES